MTSDGTRLLNLTSGQTNMSCAPGNFYLYGGRISVSAINIQPDGSFSVSFSGSTTVGSDPATYTITITGQFSTQTASGTLVAGLSFTRDGIQNDCSSGNQTWTASRSG